MANAAKFLFGQDFRKPAEDAGAVHTARAVEEAEARGYMRGLQDGQRQGEVEAQAHIAAAMERLAGAAGTMLADLDAQFADTETLAVEFALSLARKFAGDALAREPLSAIAEAASESFRHLRGVPHLVARVNDLLVEPVDKLIQRMARERGFEGRLIVLGDPDIPQGDIRLEWADGGLVRSQSQIEQAVARSLGR